VKKQRSIPRIEVDTEGLKKQNVFGGRVIVIVLQHGSESKIYGNKVEIYHLKAKITLEEYNFFSLTLSRLDTCQTTQYSRLSRQYLY